MSADRIVFAKSLPHDKHLARLQLAHLTLDTFNVNAHTTASDSLWAGVPLVTKVGQQFAGRVAASLLQAIRMPELITETEQNYEKLIIEIALDSVRYESLRAKLARNKFATSLFNTRQFTKSFEDSLQEAVRRNARGEEPANLRIPS